MKMDYGAVYSQFHENSKLFPGYTIRRRVPDIARLVAEHKPTRMLDYGSGKGYQYLKYRVQDQWGGMLPHCYDVGVRQLAERPTGTFDGIICTDVMEHIEPADVDAVLADIFSFAGAKCFALLAISCIPSKSRALPDGRNVHLTLQPPDWWKAKLAKFERPGLVIESHYETA